MLNTKKLKFVVILLLTSTLLTYCQDNKVEKEKMIKSFFEDVFMHNKSSKNLYEKYAYKSPEKEVSISKKNEIFDKHIQYLKSEKSNLLTGSPEFVVEPYNKSSLSDLLPFDKRARGNIYVISVNNKVQCYVLLNEGRIVSFNYVQKGIEGPAYFIGDF